MMQVHFPSSDPLQPRLIAVDSERFRLPRTLKRLRAKTPAAKVRNMLILEWTTSLDTSSRTLFVREDVRMSTSCRTSSYVITSDCY